MLACFTGNRLNAAPFLYVANTDDTTVSVINVATNTVIATVQLGTNPTANLAITPDNSTVFVPCFDLSVKRISVITNTEVLPAVSTAPARPNFIAITPDGLYAYVTCNDNTVRRINIATNTVDTVISGFSSPFAIAIAPNGLTAYVCNTFVPVGVIPIDIATNTLGTEVTGGALVSLFDITVDPSSSYVYVATDSASTVVQLSIANRLAPTISNVIAVPGSNLIGVTITEDANYLYAASFSPDSLTPVNIAHPTTPVVEPSVTAGAGPNAAFPITFNTSAYVSNAGDSSVTLFNISNRAAPTATLNITVGLGPIGVAITAVNGPTNVVGKVVKNIFLNATELVLVITWTPVAFNALAQPLFYFIYQGTTLVRTIPAGNPSIAYVRLSSYKSKNDYFISTLYSDGTASQPKPVMVASVA